MKKILVVVLVVAIALIGATAALAGVVGTKHDLTTANSGTATVHATASTISACQFCHTPHLLNNAAVAGAPLWNKSMPVTTGYTFYGATVGGSNITTVNATSLTCLSCHDGQASVGQVFVGGNQAITASSQNNAAGQLTDVNSTDLGVNMQKNHPISTVVTDGTHTVDGLDTLANMKTKKFVFFGVGSDTMECGTCHDPHDSTLNPFLRVAKTTICTDCHISK